MYVKAQKNLRDSAGVVRQFLIEMICSQGTGRPQVERRGETINTICAKTWGTLTRTVNFSLLPCSDIPSWSILLKNHLLKIPVQGEQGEKR